MAAAHPCLARLTNWEKTNVEIAHRFRITMVRLCPNKAAPGELICARCVQRPTTSKYQSAMIHGLLTEPPPPDSCVYGSLRYWQGVKKFEDKGETVNIPSDWLEEAEAVQAEGEERAFMTTDQAWVIQRPSAYELQMPPRGKKVAPAAQPPPLPANQKPLPFKKVEKYYQETEEAPETLATDSEKIWLTVQEGNEIWLSESGFMFAVSMEGEKKVVGKFLGRRSS